MQQNAQQQGCATRVIGFIGLCMGAGFAKVVGSAAVLPGLLALLAWWVAKKFLKPTEQSFRPAIALIGGLLFSLILGLAVIVGQGDLSDLLVPVLLGALEAIGLAAGLAWLFVRPGFRPVLFLGLLLAVGLGLASYRLSQIENNTKAEKALLVSWVMQAGALLFLVGGFIARRHQLAAQATKVEHGSGTNLTNAPPALHEGVFDPLVGSPVSTTGSSRAEPALSGRTTGSGTRRAA
jgi:hypothetical protein